MSKKRKIISTVFIILSIVLNIFILVESLIPGKASAIQSDWISQIIATITHSEVNSEFTFHIRKSIGHFLLFFLDGGLVTFTLFYVFNKKSSIHLLLISLAIGFMVASISELFQLITLERFGSLSDIQIDFSGYLLLTTIVFFIKTLFLSHKKR